MASRSFCPCPTWPWNRADPKSISGVPITPFIRPWGLGWWSRLILWTWVVVLFLVLAFRPPLNLRQAATRYNTMDHKLGGTSALDHTRGDGTCNAVQRAMVVRKRRVCSGLSVVTANGTVWSALFAFVKGLDKGVLVYLGQEHRLRDSEIDAASQAALRAGSKTFFSKSIPTEKSTSSGVVAFVRVHVLNVGKRTAIVSWSGAERVHVL